MEVPSSRCPSRAARPPPRVLGEGVLLERSAGVSRRSVPFPRKPWRSPRDGTPRSLRFHPRASGSTQAATSSIAKTEEASEQERVFKDKDLMFAMTQLSVCQMKLNIGTGTSGTEPTEKLEIVECDLEKQGDIAPVIGNAFMVLCCIEASEKEIFDITGPYRIDFKATETLMKAATVAKVDHFILLASLGTEKIGFPVATLKYEDLKPPTSPTPSLSKCYCKD